MHAIENPIFDHNSKTKDIFDNPCKWKLSMQGVLAFNSIDYHLSPWE